MQLSTSSLFFFLFFLSLSLSVASSSCGNETDVYAQVRFVHSSSKLGTVADVTCNGVSLGKGLAFGEVTEFFAFVPEEVCEFQVTLEKKEFKPVSVHLLPNTTYTFYFSYNSTSKDYYVAFATNQLRETSTNASLSVINAFLSASSPTFELLRNSSVVFRVDVPYAPTSAVPLPTLTPGNYTIRTIVVSGTVFISQDVVLVDSTSYSVVFVGDQDQTDSSRLLFIKEADFATTSVHFAHSVPDAGAVTIEVNCQEVFHNVTFGQYAPSINVRSYVTAVTVLANGEPVISETLRLTRGSNYFVFVTGTVQNKSLGLTVHEEHFSFDQSKSHVSVGNLVPDSTSLMVNYITNKTQDIKYQVFDAQTVDPNSYTFKFFKPVSLRRRIRMFRRMVNGQVSEEPLVQKQQSLQAGSSYLVVVQGTMANLTVDIVETSSAPSSDSGLSKGAIAGIIIACLVGAILVIGVAVYIYRRRSNYETIR